MKTRILSMDNEEILFDNGLKLYSEHEQDCCEQHYLSFADIKNDDLEDVERLEFDLSGDNFFTRIPDYGIQLNPINNFPLRIPGYGYNNGYYSSNLTLILEGNGERRTYDISECQEIN